jgi:hypothetical protein
MLDPVPRRPATPPPGGWDDTPKPIGARVRLATGKLAGAEGVVVKNQRVVRPAWDEEHHWVRLNTGRMVLYAPRFLEIVREGGGEGPGAGRGP